MMDLISNKNPYGVIECDVVGRTKQLQKDLFNEKGKDRQMTFQIFDVPQLFLNTKQTVSFIRALGNTDSDTDIFQYSSIRKLINYHWRGVRAYVWGL